MNAIRRSLIGLAALSLLACTDLVTDVSEYGEVTVHTVRRDGEPVPGAPLVLFIGERPMDYDTTGADGRHVFRFVPPNVFGVYAEPPEGYARLEELVPGPSTTTRSGITIEEGDTASVQFEYLKEGPGTIEVVFREPGEGPVAGLDVALFGPQGVLEGRTTDASGQVRFDPVPFGLWGIRYRPARRFREAAEDDPRFQDGILVEEDRTSELLVRLEPCVGMVVVRVNDTSGAAVPDFPVTLYSAEGTLEEATTGADGRVDFSELLCRSVGVRLERLAGWTFPEGRGDSFVDGLLVTRGSEQTVTFRVRRCRASIVARVRDQRGAAVSGVRVILYTGTGELADRPTDGSGGVVFSDLPCDAEYGVRIVPGPGYGVTYGRGSSFFDGIVLSNGQSRQLQFRVQTP